MVWWSMHRIAARELRGSNPALSYFSNQQAKNNQYLRYRSAWRYTEMDPSVDLYNNAPSQMVGLSTAM